MNKFNRYDRVKIMRGKYKDKIGLITEAEGRNYIVTGADDNFYLRIDEDFIESVPTITGENIFLDYLNESTNDEEPRFRVGDVVTVVDDVLHQHKDGIIQEVVAVDDEKSRHYEYHIADYDRPLSGWDAYEESAVRFKYHDTTWEEYYTEMMKGYRERMKQKVLMEHMELELKPIPRSFKVGNKVKASSRFASGVGIIENVSGEGEWAQYTITLQGENEPRIFYEKNLELIPKFDVGDVVSVAGHSDTVYVVNETVLVDGGQYMYNVSPAYDANSETSGYDTCEESALTFQYHDLSYEELFTEGTRIKNDLPEWRGELYNMYACYSNIITHGSLNPSIADDYEKDTLPPSRMLHIMRSHDIYWRITDVIENAGNDRKESNRDFIRKRLNVNDVELEQILWSVRDKLNAMNLEDMDSKNLKIASKRDPGFTETEKRFVALIDNLDISKKKFKDHFPVTMTALQMMDAIKDAYEHACKQGAMKIQKHDEDGGESLAAPHNGKRKYKGTSEKYHMEIEFWYNFDRDFIETAYPLGMNARPEKY